MLQDNDQTCTSSMHVRCSYRTPDGALNKGNVCLYMYTRMYLLLMLNNWRWCTFSSSTMHEVREGLVFFLLTLFVVSHTVVLYHDPCAPLINQILLIAQKYFSFQELIILIWLRERKFSGIRNNKNKPYYQIWI